MKDRAAKIQKLANDYETLANQAFNSDHKQLRPEGEKLLAKSQELAKEAKLEAFREQLEDNV